MGRLFEPRVESLDTHSTAFRVAVVGFVILVIGLGICSPLIFVGVIVALLGIALAYADRTVPHRQEGPWLSTPGAWGPDCGAPAVWMPKDWRWFSNSCGKYLAANLPPP